MKGHGLLKEIDYDNIKEAHLLGKGSYAKVFLGKYKTESTEKLFAIKVFEVYNNLKNDLTKEDVHSEIKMLKMIAEMTQIPNSLPEYYGYRTEKKDWGKIYKIYMKFEKSIELKKFFKNQIPSFSQFKLIARQLILTCAFLQEKGLCHQDLKDQNILIKERKDHSLKPILIDFGVARVIQNNFNTFSRNTKNELTLIGTLEFFSPEKRKAYLECKENEKIKINHFKSDAFSLGLVLLNLGLNEPIQMKNNLEKKAFKETLQICLIELSKQYGVGEKERKFYFGLVESMLEFKPEKRQDFISLMHDIADFERKEVEAINFLLLGAKNLRNREEEKNFEKSKIKERKSMKEEAEKSESQKSPKKKEKKEEKSSKILEEIGKSIRREKKLRKEEETEEEEEKEEIEERVSKSLKIGEKRRKSIRREKKSRKEEETEEEEEKEQIEEKAEIVMKKEKIVERMLKVDYPIFIEFNIFNFLNPLPPSFIILLFRSILSMK